MGAADTVVRANYSVDTTAPTIPGYIFSNSITATSVDLYWGGSYDAGGVAAYEVLRDGVMVGSSMGGFMVTGLTPDTTYDFTVRARDTSGNRSLPSTPLRVTTASAGLTLMSTEEWGPDEDDGDEGWRKHYQNNSPYTIRVTYSESSDYDGDTDNEDSSSTGTQDVPPGGWFDEWEYYCGHPDDNYSHNESRTIDFQQALATPLITSPLQQSFTIGVAASYPITARNSPVSYNAAGLPPGFSVNTSTGVISGTPATLGVYNVTLSATNGYGTTSATLVLTVVAISTDATAPTAPAALNYADRTAKTVTLVWRASADNVGVSHYIVYRGGVQVGTTPDLAYADSGLTASTAYSYTVKASDAAGNLSVASATLNVTTTADLSLDSDGDGIPNATETALGTNGSAAAGAATPAQTQQNIHRPLK
jgi:chitodextrinase